VTNEEQDIFPNMCCTVVGGRFLEDSSRTGRFSFDVTFRRQGLWIRKLGSCYDLMQ